MRYHYTPKPITASKYGQTYRCNHPVYNVCTLYLVGTKGLAVIQQRLRGKAVYWSFIDECLVDDIYCTPGFREYFAKNARDAKDGLYPTVPVRKLMWKLRMRPLPKQRWETTFDREFV